MYERVLGMVGDKANANLAFVVGMRLISRLEFSGRLTDAIKYNEQLLARFPDNAALMNRQGVNYLVVDKVRLAKDMFERVLELTNYSNPMALCHYAFILKQNENRVSIKHGFSVIICYKVFYFF